jgi:hypothetical protein
VEPPSEPRLNAEQEEWLLRAATGSRQGVLPFATVAALVAAGLGEKNSRGTLDVNHVGRRYLEAKRLRAIREVPRRNRSSAI